MNDNIFGRNLRFYRKKMGFTQSELGKESGLGQVSIANYERGTRFPGEKTLIKLAETLGLSLDLLFCHVRPAGKGLNRDTFNTGELLHSILNDSFDHCLNYILGWKRSGGYDLRESFREIILPALYETGIRWQGGTLSVLEEHLISERLRELIALISANERNNTEKEDTEQNVWLGLCAPSDKHDLGVFMYSQLLRNRGWRTYFLGPDVPVNDLILLAEKYKPDLINISIITDLFQNGLNAYLKNLDESGSISCPIVISGRGFNKEMAASYSRIGYIPNLLDKAYDFALELEKKKEG